MQAINRSFGAARKKCHDRLTEACKFPKRQVAAAALEARLVAELKL